jgi:hypothetical protein
MSHTVAVGTSYGGVIYSTGFEPPTYTLGNSIVGQDGWAEFNPTASFDAVQNTFVKSGLQAAWVIPVTSATVQTGMYHSDSSTGPLIDLSADIFLASSSNQNEWQFAGLGPGLNQYIGGINIFADNTIHLITAGNTMVGTTFTRNTYHHVDFLFNMNTQKYSFSLDGSLLASAIAFCGDNLPCAGAPVSTYGSSFFDVFATLNSNDLGAIDNLSLSNVTPEPRSLLLIVSGLALVVTRHRFASRKG